MSNKTKNSFYSLWSLAILLCLALSMFVLLFASCSKGGTAETDSEQTVITEETEGTTAGDAATEDTATITEETVTEDASTADDGEDEVGTDEDAEAEETETETEAETETETETETMD